MGAAVVGAATRGADRGASAYGACSVNQALPADARKWQASRRQTRQTRHR